MLASEPRPDIYGHLLNSSLEGVGEQLQAFLRHAQGTKNGRKSEGAEEHAKLSV